MTAAAAAAQMFAPPTASPPRRSVVCILEPYRVPRSMPPSWVVVRNIRDLSLTQPTPKKRERERGDATGLMIGGDEERQRRRGREGGRGASEGPNKIVAKPGVSCTALRLVPKSTCYHAYTVGEEHKTSHMAAFLVSRGGKYATVL